MNSPTFPGVNKPIENPPKKDLQANQIEVSGYDDDNKIFHFKLLSQIQIGTVNRTINNNCLLVVDKANIRLFVATARCLDDFLANQYPYLANLFWFSALDYTSQSLHQLKSHNQI